MTRLGFTFSWRSHGPWVCAAATGLMMAASFPPLEWKEVAWLALIPLMLACRTVTPRRALALGYASGLCFWVPSVSWLHYVTVPGWLILCLYASLYMAPFGAFCSLWFRRHDPARWWNNLAFAVVAAAVWVALEYARSTWFTGFAWNLLGVSQHAFVPLVQIASWGGVYAVSALLLLLNAGIATTLLRYALGRAQLGRTAHPELLIPIAAAAVAMTWGLGKIRDDEMARTPLHVGIVQPNIPQPFKWDEATVDLIFERLTALTTALHEPSGLDLIIWPETALPDDVRNNPSCHEVTRSLAWGKTPLLVGSMDTAWSDEGQPVFFNSSFLFSTNAAILGGYDKQHLVLFGEYLPFEDRLPFIRALTPNQASFTPGTNAVVMTLDPPGVSFSPLICFEDTMPYLARRAVRAGARLLINQTNDAWFEKSSASRQHMANSIFRCVEHRVPMVRAANTGVSCHIDPFGVIRDVLQDDTGNTFVDGTLRAWVMVPPQEMPPTFYTQRGDLLALVCAAVGALWAAQAGWAHRRRAG